MTVNQPDVDQLRRAVNASLHDHWLLYFIEGIVLFVLGFAAIALPPIATLATTILFGWLFLISGIVGLVTTFWMRGAPGFWWSLLSGVLGIIVGVILLAWPVSGAVSLTLVLAVFFTVEGVATIMFALEHRKELTGRWGWMLASGVIDLIIAAIIVGGFPGTAAWALGLLVGVNLVFGGSAMMALALAARSNETSAPAHA